MREVFHQSLEDVQYRLVEIAELVTVAIDKATRAFGTSDVGLAEEVIADDAHIDERAIALDEIAIEILARQQPVARDLRIVVTALRVSASLERMGDLAEHIAQLARYRFPERAVPKGLKSTFARMGELDVDVARKLTELLRTQDLSIADEIRNLDDVIDELHVSVFEKVLGENWQGEARRDGRRDAGQPLPRAVRRSRGRGRQEGPLPRDRRLVARTGVRRRPLARSAREKSPRRIRRGLFSRSCRGGCYPLPWAATAAAPAAAASGSRYSPGPSGTRFSSSL